jgi:hypothetical protein
MNMVVTSKSGFRSSALVSILFFVPIFLGACQGIFRVTAELPEEARLRARLKDFHGVLDYRFHHVAWKWDAEKNEWLSRIMG